MGSHCRGIRKKGLIAVLLILVCSILYVGYKIGEIDSSINDNFSPELGSYVKMYYTAISSDNNSNMYSNNNLPLGNVLIGKAIVIDITKNNYKLSESPFSNGDLKYYNIIPIADNPNEVYTLIVMNHYYGEVGRYTDNMSGFREHYNVTLINTKTLGYVSQDFEGSMPPNQKTGSGPAYGSSPESDVREYLRGLEKISENEYMTQLSIYL